MKSRYWRMGLVAGLGLFCGWMSARILPGLGKGVACCFSCFFPCFNFVFLRGGWPGLAPAGEVLFLCRQEKYPKEAPATVADRCAGYRRIPVTYTHLRATE